MQKKIRSFINEVMDHQPDLTIATLRKDGWPQANTVSYAHDGLVIYFGTDKNSQKVKNITHCDKVSLTINNDYKGDWNKIKGISMAATATILKDKTEVQYAIDCIIKRFPLAAEWASTEDLANMVYLKLTPSVISVLDYAQGFGHAEQISI
ncbi:MAG: pyridoxamine 5'-phosphate oxidase family protein [Burkholderiales bacterium]